MRIAAESPSRGFPKAARLRKPAEFKQVAVARRQIVVAPLVLSFCEAAVPRLGLAIAKKAAPNASDRNRIKRLIREDFRQHRAALPGADLVYHARVGVTELDNAAIRQRLAELRRQLNRRCKPSSPAPSASTSGV